MSIGLNAIQSHAAQVIKKQPKVALLHGRHKKTKATLLAIATISSASAKIPYVSIAMKAKPIGVGVAVCDISMWFFAEMNWAVEIVDDVFFENPFETESALCKNVTTGLSAFGIALIAQLPAVAPAATYNKEWEYEAGAVVAISGAILATRGLQLSIQKMCRCGQRTETGEAQKHLITVLSDHLEMYLKADLATKVELAEKLDTLRSHMVDPNFSDDQAIQEFEKLIVSGVTDSDTTPLLRKSDLPTSSCGRWAGEKIVQTLGAACTLFFELCVGYYTYDWMEGKTHSWALSLALCAISMAGWAYMIGAGVTAIATGALRSVVDRCTGNHQPTLAEKLAPQGTMVMKGTAFVMGAFATATTWIIWRDFFDKKGVWTWRGKKAVQRTAMGNNVVAIGSLLYSSTFPAIDKQVENWLLHHEPEGRGKLVAYSRTIKEIISLVEIAPSSRFQTRELRDYALNV